MSSTSHAEIPLAPCPFCSEPLKRSGGVNPLASCETATCWLGQRHISIPLDDPKQVRLFNKRACGCMTPAAETVVG